MVRCVSAVTLLLLLPLLLLSLSLVVSLPVPFLVITRLIHF